MSKKSKAASVAKPVGGMALAAKWPVHEVLISRDRDSETALTTILVARRSPMSGKVAAGLLLVDLACLGVKSAQLKLFAGPHDDARRIVDQLTRAVGAGNFHYMVGGPDGDFDMLGEDD